MAVIEKPFFVNYCFSKALSAVTELKQKESYWFWRSWGLKWTRKNVYCGSEVRLLIMKNNLFCLRTVKKKMKWKQRTVSSFCNNKSTIQNNKFHLLSGVGSWMHAAPAPCRVLLKLLSDHKALMRSEHYILKQAFMCRCVSLSYWINFNSSPALN